MAFATFHQRLERKPIQRAAIIVGHHQVLGHVDESAGEVTGVRGFQGRIGQTFTGAMGRDEVLEDVQAFAEV